MHLLHKVQIYGIKKALKTHDGNVESFHHKSTQKCEFLMKEE